MIRVTGRVDGDKAQARVSRLVPQITGAVSRTVRGLTIELQAIVKSDYLSGQVLKNRTGTLRRSILEDVTESGTSIMGRVYIGSDAPYGAAFELGGTRWYVIEPTRKKCLAFIMGGQPVFAMRVNHPPVPKRPFLVPALEQLRPEITERLAAAIGEAVR